MKTLNRINTLGLLITALGMLSAFPAHSQEADPVAPASEPSTAPAAVPTEDDTITTDTGAVTPDPADTLTLSGLNTSQQEKVMRLSAASGVSVDEILRLRSGADAGETEPSVDDGTVEPADPTIDPAVIAAVSEPNGKGWGVIAKWLGVHPSELGKGKTDASLSKTKKDKELKTSDEEALPELDELPPESDAVVDAAQDLAIARAEAKVGEKDKHSDSLRDSAESSVESSIDSSKDNNGQSRDSVEEVKADKPDKTDKPEKPVKDDKPEKPTKDDNGHGNSHQD